LCSTIGELFSGDSTLFDGLAISEEESWNFAEEKRPVIHLNMSHLGDSLAEITAGMTYLLNLENYGIKLDDYSNYAALSWGQKLHFIIRHLAAQHKTQVVVIIDEYDAPILRLMDEPDQQKKIIEKLSNFYGVLKNLEDHLRLVYITGVLKFSSSMSLFSSLNNIKDLTFSTQASAICGYTDEELEHNYMQQLELLAQNKKMGSTKEARSSLKEMFNGYCFGLNTGLHDCPPVRVFNPFGVNKALSDGDMVLEMSHSGRLAKLLMKSKAAVKALDCVEVPLSDLLLQQTPDAISFEGLLYYAGYSTIRAYDRETGVITLAPPNESIRSQLLKAISKELRDGDADNNHRAFAKSLVVAMFGGTKQKHRLQELFNMFVALFPHQSIKKDGGEPDLQSSKGLEAAYNVLFSAWLMQGEHDQYKRIDNEISSNQGDIDLAWENRADGTICLIEFTVNRSTDDALQQMKKKGFNRTFPWSKKLIYVGVNITKNREVEVGIEEVAVSPP
jgi:hypothetical protein